MRSTLLRLVGLVTLCATPALAQSNPQTRDGFTISFGVGGGSAGVTCEDACDSDRETAPAVYLRLGGAYRPNLILGGEINVWSKQSEEDGVDGTITVGTVNAFAQWYPQPTGGFFVAGGLGVGSMNVEVKVPGLPTISDRTTGLGYHVGAGYDIRLGKNFSLTPYATFFGTAGGKVESNSEKIDANVAQIGLGFTWH
jgi:hypothetical protein